MKKLLFLSLFIFFYCLSCKKDADKADTSGYYIKATFNGVEKKFSDFPHAQDNPANFSPGFYASAENNSTNETMSLKIVHPYYVRLALGTYNSSTDSYIPGSTFTISDTLKYGSGADFAVTNSNLQIVIVSSTTKYIDGTFSGKFFNEKNVSDTISVKNGSFHLPYQYQ